jgi:hypothetical protein
MFTTCTSCDVALMLEPSVTTLAYLAGVIDGEGCIAIRKTKRTGSFKSTRYSASITVGNTSRLLIEQLMAVFTAGCVTYRYPTKSKRACYVWTVSSLGARKVLRLVRPYLIVKSEQAAVLLEFIDEFDSFKGARLGKKGGQLVSPEELARRERLYQQMRYLNRVGPRVEDRPPSDGRMSVGVTAEFIAVRQSGAR